MYFSQLLPWPAARSMQKVLKCSSFSLFNCTLHPRPHHFYPPALAHQHQLATHHFWPSVSPTKGPRHPVGCCHILSNKEVSLSLTRWEGDIGSVPRLILLGYSPHQSCCSLQLLFLHSLECSNSPLSS